MKVLLFSNDLMPFGTLPTSGGGLRAWQLYQGLRAHGITVVASMPGFTFLARKHEREIPDEQRELLWQFGTQDEILWKTKPDAVLFTSNWDHFDLHTPLTIPLIVDLHGPRILETRMWGHPVSTEKKIQVFNRADCMLVAGKFQRQYFSGWLTQAGRIANDDHLLRYIPISLDPDLPGKVGSESSNYPTFVSGGGWFPWQDQSRAIFSVAEQLERAKTGKLKIFGGPHEKMGDSPDERRIRFLFEEVRKKSESSQHIEITNFIGRTALLEQYARADVALELMRYNLERELAFTTRTIEYLWCGLPVIYNDYSEISSHINEYEAGWSISPEDPRALSDALETILGSRDELRRRSSNAQMLVKDRFTWDRTIAPLVEFLKFPKDSPRGEAAYGSVYSRPAFLSVRGDVVDTVLSSNQAEVFTNFVVPAEDISSVEVPMALAEENARNFITGVELRITSKSGRVIATRTVPPLEVPQRGRVAVKFPILQQPRGGTPLKLRVRVKVRSNQVESIPLLILQGVRSRVFPLLDENDTSPVRSVYLALSFTPGDTSPFSRARALAQRAITMAREGEWERLIRAVRRRIPGLVYRLRQRITKPVIVEEAKGRSADS